MKAMILAAGFGTRLGDIGKQTPKCLVQAGDTTMLEHVVNRVKAAGVDEIVINLHHLGAQIIRYVESKNSFGVTVRYSEEETILGTGGGILHARRFLERGEGFIVHNGDIYSELDLRELVKAHQDSDALATLAVMDRSTKRPLLFDDSGLLVGWEGSEGRSDSVAEETPPPAEYSRLAFSGIHIISPRIFEFMDEKEGAFSIIHTYMQAVRSGEKVRAFRMDDAYWIDVGTVDKLQQLQERLR